MRISEISQQPQNMFDEDKDIMSRDEIGKIIAHYEQIYQMDSDEFLRQRHEGKAPDTFETMDWMMLLKYC